MNDLHHFYFIELVLANQTAHVFTVCARFGAETWGMGGQLQRQIAACHDTVGNGVGQRHFGGRNQILRFFALVAAAGNMEQIFCKFRQLACALQGGVVHDVGRVMLGVAVFQRVRIEHELRQRAVQAGDLTFHDGKARAGEFRAAFEIQAQRFAQIDMVFDFKVKFARGADFADFDVFSFVFTNRHAFVRQVGNAQQPCVQFFLNSIQIGGGLLQIGFDLGDLIHGCLRLFVFALSFQCADLFGNAVARGLQFFGFHLDGFALLFQGIETCGIKLVTALRQTFGDGCGVAAELLDV